MSTSFTLKSSRLEALTDGIFAIAMTILVFNLMSASDLSHVDLTWRNHHLYYKLFIYVGSFIILGTSWVGMVFQYSFLERLDRFYLWLNIVFLMFTGIVPFSAFLLAQSNHALYDINFYSINLLCISLMQAMIFYYAQRKRLNNQEESNGKIAMSIYHRIGIALLCYVLALIVAPWGNNIAFILLLIPPIVHIFPGKVDNYVT